MAITYQNTSNITIKSSNYIQSLILSSLVATTIMQAIGDNVAVGLGMLGALSIIQFRTSFRDPRDIIFMFAALGTGIACGVYGFYVAILGTILFCAVAVILRFTPFHNGRHVVWELRVRSDSGIFMEDFHLIMDQFCIRYDLDNLRIDAEKGKEPYRELDYKLILKNEADYEELINNLHEKSYQVKKMSRQGEEQIDNS
ncbi:MAG: DUF4956 domain-containing protein [Saprospiraceae bacterium]|nr:DUF4956 domain-containing protein [Candidatus Vicinibacter affinis]